MTAPSWPSDEHEAEALRVAEVICQHFVHLVLGWTEWSSLEDAKRIEIEAGLRSVVVAEFTKALVAGPPDGWRPIESAPRDGPPDNADASGS